MRPWGPKRRYWLFVQRRDNNYGSQKVVLTPGGLVPKHVTIDGERYRFDPSMAFRMSGWDPFKRRSWWEPLWSWLDPRKPYMLVYEQGNEEPVDHACKVQWSLEVGPRLHQALTRNKLYDSYLRRLNYGAGINPTVLLLVIVGLSVLLFLLYMGGWFG